MTNRSDAKGNSGNSGSEEGDSTRTTTVDEIHLNIQHIVDTMENLPLTPEKRDEIITSIVEAVNDSIEEQGQGRPLYLQKKDQEGLLLPN